MLTSPWIYVFPLIPVLEGTILFKRQNKNCEVVVMCPQFCLKIKDGCYICQCGESINTYMEGAIQKMKHDYDPIYQTGSKMTNLNMGTNTAPDDQNASTRNSQWMNMAAYGGSSFGGPMMGAVGTLGQSVSQSGHYLEPDFKEFYRPAGMALPGRCPEMNYACPGRCWKTDGFSGCFRCECGDTSSTTTTPALTKTPSSGQSTTEGQTTTDVQSTAQERSPELTTKPTITSSTVTSIKQMTSQSIDLHHIKGNVAETTSLVGFLTNQSSTSNMSSENVSSSLMLNQLNSLLNGNTGLSPISVPTGAKGATSDIEGGLANLNGVDLFKILIDGIKQHKSLPQVLYSLAQKVSPSHPEEKTEGQGQTVNMSLSSNHSGDVSTKDIVTSSVTSNRSQPAEVLLSHVMTTENPVALQSGVSGANLGAPEAKHPQDCLTLGADCPAECHVTDPVSKCPVCSCSGRQNETSNVSTHLQCAPLDVTCPSECITLDRSLCPVCVCKHRQIDMVSTGTLSSTSPSAPTDAVCRITEEIRNCDASCLKLDDSFCPICACASDSSSETPNSQDNENTCPAVERGCPQKCLTFDENYCAYCFCDNKK